MSLALLLLLAGCGLYRAPDWPAREHPMSAAEALAYCRAHYEPCTPPP